MQLAVAVSVVAASTPAAAQITRQGVSQARNHSKDLSSNTARRAARRTSARRVELSTMRVARDLVSDRGDNPQLSAQREEAFKIHAWAHPENAIAAYIAASMECVETSRQDDRCIDIGHFVLNSSTVIRKNTERLPPPPPKKAE